VTRVSGAAALVAALLVCGCSVVPLPQAVAVRDQNAREHAWDIKDCQAEAGYRTGYSSTDSPLANFFQRVFFWGTAGAAVGGLITGLPASVTSTASEGLIAGAGAGGVAGTLQSWSGQRRFERAWIACMEARGYTVAPREERPQSLPTSDEGSSTWAHPR
jgi:hypothetical protein